VSAESTARNNAITAAIDALKGGVSTAYDTLVEIAAKFAADDGVIAGILSSIATKLNKAGDTMTGDLSIDKPTVQGLRIKGRIAGKDRWTVQLGDGTAEGGANAGSNLSFLRYTDAGALIDTPFTVNRATGNAAFTAALSATRITASNDLVAHRNNNTGCLYLGNALTTYLMFDGTNINCPSWVMSPRSQRYADVADLGGYMASSTAYGTFVTGVRGVYAGDVTENGSNNFTEIGNAWMTGRRMGFDDNGGYRYRYVQYAINGGWYTAGWAS
jgi:hypothetical protein